MQTTPVLAESTASETGLVILSISANASSCLVAALFFHLIACSCSVSVIDAASGLRCAGSDADDDWNAEEDIDTFMLYEEL